MAKKKVTKKAAARPAAAKSRSAASKSVKPAAAKSAAPLPAPAPAAPAPAPAPRPAGGAPKPLMLVIFAVVALLVVVEMSALLKGKLDRQRSLSEVSTFGERGGAERPEAFHGPLLIKCDPQDRLLMVDSDWKKILVWDTKTTQFSFALDKTAAQVEDFQPADVTADAQGNLFVLDRIHNQIFAFGPDGKLVRAWTAPAISAIAVTPKGQLAASDAGRQQVVLFSYEGEELKRFGGPGDGEGQFNNPYRLDADADGNLYVLDSGNQRVQALSAAGAFLRTWKLKFKPAILTGLIVRGKEVFFNDFDNNFIWIYSTSGRLIGQISNQYPSTMAIDGTGMFYLPGPGGLTRFVQVKGKKK